MGGSQGTYYKKNNQLIIYHIALWDPQVIGTLTIVVQNSQRIFQLREKFFFCSSLIQNKNRGIFIQLKYLYTNDNYRKPKEFISYFNKHKLQFYFFLIIFNRIIS